MASGFLHDYLKHIVLGLVDYPDAVALVEEHDSREQTVILELRVHEDDAGKVLGKSGETAKAIRKLLYAAARRTHVRTVVFNILNRKNDGNNGTSGDPTNGRVEVDEKEKALP